MGAGLTGDDLGTPYLRLERRGPLAWCVVDRPDARNALTSAMYFGIRRAVDLVNRDPALAALIITGTGDVFMPGGELRGREPDRWLDFPDLLGLDSTPFEAIRRSPKPVVSAVNGIAQGGGLLIAMLSDVAVAGRSVTVRAPELFRGIADTGYACYLPAQIGIARARDMLLTGRTVTAEEAVEWGMFSRVVDDADVHRVAEDVAIQICRTAPQARLQVKRLINERYGTVDRMTFDALLYNDEMVEGGRAFAEKREPSWVPEEFRGGQRL
ncbi:enoyl-CoA hydratase/isomerase family protein [Actinocorallia sp. A-T 12471]|uniref:enoyl-CoA hydratase/isomerase family protein n=1 Tax=Actinocorallia sp. A-T 12471 TaxID=3089813 RepID=UPI0029CCA158|nr:enoyl-CoA hydratase/isomerase family protein [Actinocorallia sp. A-T 12471]MDX6740947.1 enoyl-CoA hydratase/isomerase family protein [Actinocorallia sp. A-T 12471]